MGFRVWGLAVLEFRISGFSSAQRGLEDAEFGTLDN